MILLLVVMGVTLLYGASKHTKTRKKLCVQTVTVILTFFSGLRTWWYGDLIKYYTQYLACNGSDWRDAVFNDYNNLGLRLMFRLSGRLGISYDFCLFVIAAFAAITLGILIFRYSSSPYWSYLMYLSMGFYIFTYSGLKQTVAMGFCCLAMCAIMEKKPARFLLWVLLGGLFHAPALIFLPAYPFARQKINRFYFLFILLALAAVFIFRNQLVTFLSKMYYDDEQTVDAAKLIGGRFLMMVFILVLALFLRPLHTEDEQYRYAFNIMVFAAVLQTFSVYDNIFTRLADYYYQFVVLFIPFILEPAETQLARNPKLKKIRNFDSTTYALLGLGITAFAIWFYASQIDGEFLLTSFLFRWEIDPYALYGK